MSAAIVERVREARWYGSLVRESRRYVLRELTPREALAAYRVEPSGLSVLVRHHFGGRDGETPENWPLHEIFRLGAYVPPPAVEERMRSAREPVVVDLGANVGLFGVYVFGRYPHARVTGFEPDPRNAAVLRECVRRNRLGERWRVVEAAAAPAEGTLAFVGGAGGRSHVAGGGEDSTDVVPAVDVLPALQGADLVKIDVEGSEWPLLDDPRFAAAEIGAVVIEYHSIACPEDNPRRAARRRLEDAGFSVEPSPVDDNPEHEPFWGCGVLWAWR